MNQTIAIKINIVNVREFQQTLLNVSRCCHIASFAARASFLINAGGSVCDRPTTLCDTGCHPDGVQLDPHWIVFPPLPGLTEQLTSMLLCVASAIARWNCMSPLRCCPVHWKPVHALPVAMPDHFDDIFAGSLQSGKLGDVALNNCRACNSSKGPASLQTLASDCLCSGCLSYQEHRYRHPGYFHQPFDLQHDQRFTYHRPRTSSISAISRSGGSRSPGLYASL